VSATAVDRRIRALRPPKPSVDPYMAHGSLIEEERRPNGEIERALTQHDAVLEAAVVAAPDEKWGETPVAFVSLKEGASATEAALIEHVRTQLARFKAPRRIVFGALPKTATGKVQKNVLRERVRSPQE